MKAPVRTTQDANKIDLVDFLQYLGFSPTKIIRDDYWYCSTLRDENNASFKVNRKLNAWYDHGTGKGGSFVDFGIEYFECSVNEFLRKLSENSPKFSFHSNAGRDPKKPTEKLQQEGAKIKIVNSQRLSDPKLICYLKSRDISRAIADRFCQEIEYQIKDKKFVSIGFKNYQGGYELRSEYFKGSSSPKSPTLIKNGGETLAVFEGFFSFLSFQVLVEKNSPSLSAFQHYKYSDFLVLNSLAFLEKSRMKIESYKEINLFLDNDKAGREATLKTVAWSTKIGDRSELYKGHKDLNDFLVFLECQKQGQRKSRGLRQ